MVMIELLLLSKNQELEKLNARQSKLYCQG